MRMVEVINEFSAIEEYEARQSSSKYLVAGRAVLANPLFPTLPTDLDMFQEARPVFVAESAVTRSNVEEWANRLMVVLASGMTGEFIFCIPLAYSNRIAVKIMANSKNTTVCVTEKALILYYGSNERPFHTFFGLYGVVH